MGRGHIQIALMAMLAPGLAGCGFADSRSSMPEFMRGKAPEPASPEALPDIKRLVAAKLDAVFTAASHPTNVRVSTPRHDPRGLGWTACVRAELTSVMGKPLGTQTYRVTIVEGMIDDRRHIEGEDTCDTESYEPI